MKRLIVMEKESWIERVEKSETPGSVRRTCGQNHIPDRGEVHIATESYKKQIRHSFQLQFLQNHHQSDMCVSGVSESIECGSQRLGDCAVTR